MHMRIPGVRGGPPLPRRRLILSRWASRAWWLASSSLGGSPAPGGLPYLAGWVGGRRGWGRGGARGRRGGAEAPAEAARPSPVDAGSPAARPAPPGPPRDPRAPQTSASPRGEAAVPPATARERAAPPPARAGPRLLSHAPSPRAPGVENPDTGLCLRGRRPMGTRCGAPTHRRAGRSPPALRLAVRSLLLSHLSHSRELLVDFAVDYSSRPVIGASRAGLSSGRIAATRPPHRSSIAFRSWGQKTAPRDPPPPTSLSTRMRPSKLYALHADVDANRGAAGRQGKALAE
jgi:hypothetical protein